MRNASLSMLRIPEEQSIPLYRFDGLASPKFLGGCKLISLPGSCDGIIQVAGERLEGPL